MLRLCSTHLLLVGGGTAAAKGPALFLVRSLASNVRSSSSGLPSSPPSVALSLESLEAYATKLSERQQQQQKKAPLKRKTSTSKRRLPPPPPEPKYFDDLPLSPLVHHRLQQLDLKLPTDVQNSAIPVLLGGDDAAIQSYTGSGKTLAYLLPILSRVGPLKQDSDVDEPVAASPSKRGIEAVVVAPSRELAMQIVREAERVLGPEHKKAVQQLVGGANRSRQDEALKKNKPFIVVGTPGRISEVSRDGRLHTHGCRFLVLDEADELLSVQFREDMRRILEHVGVRKKAARSRFAEQVIENVATGLENKLEGEAAGLQNKNTKRLPERVERQTVLVSATMPAAVLRAAIEWGQKPVIVKGKAVVDAENAPTHVEQDDRYGVKQSLPPSLQHFYAVSPLQHRVDMARRCIHALNAKSVIVFMNHPRRLKDTVFKLEARGILAASLHGELGKLERTNTLAAFRNGKLRVLVTSEVGARGLDVPDCDMVVNLELPTDMTHYAHRAGRTGRLGRTGIVVSICEEREVFVVRKFGRLLGISIDECELVKGGMVLSKDAESGQKPELLRA